MELNKTHQLILKDVYVYDIEACHYTILTNLGFDLTHIDPTNKLERNIEIGKLMRKNPRITSILRSTTNNIINDYISKNNIKLNDIIVRQYDGLILTKTLSVTNIGHIPLEMRKYFYIFISSFNRKMYVAIDNTNEISVKGISHKYNELNYWYKKLILISELNNTSLFDRLQNFKDSFYREENPKMFGIPKKDGYIIFLKEYGDIEISQSTLKILDADDIDKKRYWDIYIKPFTKSIVYEHLKEER